MNVHVWFDFLTTKQNEEINDRIIKAMTSQEMAWEEQLQALDLSEEVGFDVLDDLHAKGFRIVRGAPKP